MGWWSRLACTAALVGCGDSSGSDGMNYIVPTQQPGPAGTGGMNVVGTGGQMQGGAGGQDGNGMQPLPGSGGTPADQGEPNCDFPGTAGSFYDRQIQVGADNRSYFIHVPVSYDPCAPMPMLLFFHGTDRDTDPEGNQDHYVRYTNLPDTADANDFILVIPSGLEAPDTYVGPALVWYWSKLQITERNDALVLALLDELQRQYHVDASQMFFAGFSSGAHYSVHLLVEHGELFAGAGVFAGSRTGKNLANAPRIPAFLRVGVDDSGYIDKMPELRDAMVQAGWVLGGDLDYEEIAGLPHEYPTPWTGPGYENQEMWDFFTRAY